MVLKRACFAAAAALSCATPALAHPAQAESSFEPNDVFVLALILLAVGWFLAGWRNLPRRRRGGRSMPLWRNLLFLAGMLSLAIALLPPLDRLADAHFSAHMGQHLILLVVAPPLLAASQAQLVMLQALPLRVRRTIGRFVGRIPGAQGFAHHASSVWLVCLGSIAVLWFWHLPYNYELARRHEAVHDLEHFLFLASELAFWRVILFSGNRRLSHAGAAAVLALMGLQGSLLAALITLASTPLYTSYGTGPVSLADQSLGGVMMWVLASIVYLGAFTLTLGLALARGGSRSGRPGRPLFPPLRTEP